MVDRGSDGTETDVFAPDPVELELWSEEVARSRQEYYTSPGPHSDDTLRVRKPAPPLTATGPARRALEQALEDLQAERFRSASLRRMITRLQRQIIQLEIRTGDRDSQGNPLQGLRPGDQDDEPAGYGLLLATVRGEENDEGEGEDEAWTA